MTFFTLFKNTVFLSVFLLLSCGNQPKKTINKNIAENSEPTRVIAKAEITPVIVAANRTELYIANLKNKRVAVVANQTSVIFNTNPVGYTHLIDSLLSLQIDIKTVFAPEHGFRGKADAGEKVKDGVDTKTGLPIISLYGKNRKPSQNQLNDIDVVLFDIQDVGVRFYTYIATMQLVMEACAEKNIPVVVLDRPNPNAHYVGGPTMEKAHESFLGMTTIPLVYGMTIGEYAQMINEEAWLANTKKVDLTVVPLLNWTYTTPYNLAIRPSPNLPNDISINLYPSLGLFEGTTINAGRGTEYQFQRYGASFLDSTQYGFNYIPKPNFGSKYPKEENKKCFGKDLSTMPKMNEVSLEWLINAYNNSKSKSTFFNTKNFTKHAGTKKLQQQIEAGVTAIEIKKTWQEDIQKFKTIRAKYLKY